MKFFLILSLIIFLSWLSLEAFEASMLNLQHVSRLESGEKVLTIRHRFLGDFTEDPLENFFGMDAGANVALSFRYALPYNFELDASYTRRKKEKSLGAAYRIPLEDFPVRTQVNISYFTYEELSQEKENRNNLLYLLTVQNEELFERLTATINLGYDGYNERFILGAGMSVKIIDDLRIIGEYYPVLDRDSTNDNLNRYIGEEDVYAFGLKIDTYGHHFIFLLSNSENIGVRRTSLGTIKDSGLKFGFNIERRF